MVQMLDVTLPNLPAADPLTGEGELSELFGLLTEDFREKGVERGAEIQNKCTHSWGVEVLQDVM